MELKWSCKGMHWVSLNLPLGMKMMKMILKFLAVALILVKGIMISVSFSIYKHMKHLNAVPGDHIPLSINLKFFSQLRWLLSFCAASGFEFSKVSKPRVRHTKPWVSSISAKSTNRSIYKEVQSNTWTPQLVSKDDMRLRFSCSCIDCNLHFGEGWLLWYIDSSIPNGRILSTGCDKNIWCVKTPY